MKSGQQQPPPVILGKPSGKPISEAKFTPIYRGSNPVFSYLNSRSGGTSNDFNMIFLIPDD
ncbi:MAG: hypothetical protein LBV75_07390 [Paludibacter sp.]|jgi:hypothetical protein|nr:hypothetical protein [Paludibacter sp.]